MIGHRLREPKPGAAPLPVDPLSALMVESFSGAQVMDAGEAPPPHFEPIGLEMMELLHRRSYRRRCSSGLGGPDPVGG